MMQAYNHCPPEVEAEDHEFKDRLTTSESLSQIRTAVKSTPDSY